MFQFFSRIPKSCIVLALGLTFAEPSFAADVSPSDSNIRYLGRWEMTDPAHPKTSWGHGFQVNFTGTSIAVKMSQTGTQGIYYEYSIDGADYTTVNGSGSQVFSLATNLSAGSHSLDFRRRLEASYGVSTFDGLVLDDGAVLEAPDPAAALQLEFIGDSITAGFGSEGSQSVTTNNINVTWAARLTEMLGAERLTVARSGIGISVDVNGTELSMPKRYPDTHFTWGGTVPAWDFSQKIPQGVFILLGTNDYVYASPSAAVFEAAYSSFLETVRSNYPQAHLFVVNVVQGRTTPDAKWTQASASLQAVVDDQNSLGDDRVYFVDPGDGLVNADFSDTTHPLPSGHQKMAENLYALVKDILGGAVGGGMVGGSAPSGTGGSQGLPAGGVVPGQGNAGTPPGVGVPVGQQPGGAPGAGPMPTYVDGNGNPASPVAFDEAGRPLDAEGNYLYVAPEPPTGAATEPTTEMGPSISLGGCSYGSPKQRSSWYGGVLLIFAGLFGLGRARLVNRS
ncbi:MAG: GDSL-type esterase/lipase family protein [Polyangiaceae bacterium]|nr:GDSL-type esterase/lipase family protein [Polyangiaceae bacterium]